MACSLWAELLCELDGAFMGRIPAICCLHNFSWAYETPQGLSAFWLVGTAGNLNVQFGIILLILCFWWHSHPPLCLKMIQIPMFYLLQRLRLQLTLEQHDFELCESSYSRFVSVNMYYSTMWSMLGWIRGYRNTGMEGWL